MPIGGGFTPGFSSGFDVDTTNPINGIATVTGNLTQVHELTGLIDGDGFLTGHTVAGGVGFEIPYLLGQGGVATVSLVSTLVGQGSIIGALSQIHQLSANSIGGATSTGALTVTGSQVMSGTSAGVGSLIGELFVNRTADLSGVSDGSSSVIVTMTSLIGGDGVDSGSITHMYLFTNVGVGFDPTDIYTGTGNIVAQIFPDGHTRDDFWEYLYVYLNIGVGFDPTDDASTRPDFVSQVFPDGHTAFDFHEYLYLYLNVVRGFQQHGQLVIRPGFTLGPILPGAKPPKNVPA